MMIHSFIVARLLPRLAWTPYGQRAATSLLTKPFLALHLKDETGILRAPNLFVVTHEKPNWPGSEYFVLDGKTDDSLRSLTVVPPLPFKVPLYLSVTPHICATFPDVEDSSHLLNDKTYQLDDISASRFLAALKDAGPSIYAPRVTGSDEEAGPDWDTWSGYTPREVPGIIEFGHQVVLFFESLPFDSLTSSFEVSLFDEILLIRQLVLDYSYEGIWRVISYIDDLRRQMASIAASGRIFRSPSLSSGQDGCSYPSFDPLHPSAVALQSLPVIHDGDPPGEVEPEDELADDLRDEEMPVLEMHMAAKTPAVLAEDIRIIALDSNVLIDRDGPLKEVLTSLFPPSRFQHSAEELLDRYVEYETLRASDGQLESPLAVVRDVARYLSIDVEDAIINGALQHHSRPRLLTDAVEVVKAIIEQGHVPIAIPSTAARAAVAPIEGLSLELFDIAARNPPLSWDAILSFCKDSHQISRPTQILVVSSDLYRICESASQAGFPTAFLKVKGSRSGHLSIPTIAPTYTLTQVADLLQILHDPQCAPPPPEPVVDRANPPFRVRDAYQCTRLLGTGSFAYVWNAVQVHTAASVAVKFELIHPTDPPTIPYESAVYAQLYGVQGIPRVHWSGQDMNANVLVMDKLGPNLEQMRLFCRGRLGLKTILMLGEQMLATIEQVHAKGIIVRDIKPENFALGFVEDYRRLFLFDLGLAKLYLDRTGAHIPFREGRAGIGTPRYASHNVHFGLEPSRRDDVEAIGILLLFLLHGRLPWQGICAPDILSKLRRIGEMKRGKPFADLLSQSPAFFTPFFEHCRALEFADKPDYAYLRRLLHDEMDQNGWEYDWQYDWWQAGERGTLLPEEYKLDKRWVEPVRRVLDTL
ncbi:hypothetical protein HGRIS_010689 [Hohenbuehelia grisea]|uniref:Protein kinase domain-containing protein n=1 Tax=Hohenbuehelia grisea TaxID=104357 RepID=A0ABR3IXF5_9AGAR